MISLWRQFVSCNFSRPASRWGALALMLVASSCNSMQRPLAKSAATDPFLNDESRSELASRAEAKRDADVPAAQDPTRFVRQAGFETASGAEGRRLESAAIQQIAAEERLPACYENPAIDESPAAAAKRYPDEYLFDGGDREHPIHYNDYQMIGLDTEDTAVEFREEGKRRVKPSNRVPIYSPRFAAVTSISQPSEDVGGGRPTQAIVSQAGLGFKNREGTVAQHQRDMTERLVTRLRGSGLTNADATDAVDQPISIQGHVHTATPLQDFGFLRTGQVQQADEARLAASIQSAVTWTRDQNPVVTAKSDSASELRSRFQGQELVGRENRFNGKAKLRIVKLANKTVAQPGEIVTFTIRIDNIGDREVTDVVVVDNLTPRLEYVDDSATCDVNGQLITTDNEEGSLVLRWELDEPLAGRSGCVVTFQARVR